MSLQAKHNLYRILFLEPLTHSQSYKGQSKHVKVRGIIHAKKKNALFFVDIKETHRENVGSVVFLQNVKIQFSVPFDLQLKRGTFVFIGGNRHPKKTSGLYSNETHVQGKA